MSTCDFKTLDSFTNNSDRNQFINGHCNQDYKLLNLVNLYFNYLGESNLLMWMMMMAFVPLLFLHMSLIADHYLSISLRRLAKKLKLSPAIAAVTITSFSAGAPDVMSSISNADKSGGAQIGVGILMGSFIFSTTLVISNVLFSSISDIKLEKWPIIKEMSFYLLSIFIIVCFGIYGQVNYGFLGLFAIVYVSYIYITVKIDHWKPKEALFFTKEEEEEVKLIQDTQEYHVHYEISSKDDKAEEMISWKEVCSQGFVELHDERRSIIVNILCYPLTITGLFVLPYNRNPLIKTHLRYFVYLGSSFYLVDSLFYITLSKGSSFSAAIVITVLISILDFFSISKKTIRYFQVVMTIFCSILTLKFYVLMIIDFITFLSFMYTIDNVILSAILLSAGDTMGDFFANGALAHQGEIAMASIATFSNQTFNILIGLGANIFMNLQNGVFEFDIFGIHNKDKVFKMRNWFLMLLVIACVGNICVHWYHYSKNNFHLEKKFADFLIVEYLVFFFGSLVFGALSHVKEIY